jgi:DNA polymerase III delta subunit
MIITLSGSNDFLIENELKKITMGFSSNKDDYAIEQIDGAEADFDIILESISNLSFLSPAKLVILRRASSNRVFTDSLEEILNKIPDSTTLAIVEPNIDKRTSYYKLLKKITDFRNYDELDINGLAKWIVDLVKEKKGIISSSDARYLVELAGENQLKLSNEIDKLISFSSNISRENIDNLVDPIPQTTIFQLLDSAFSGDNKRIIKIYKDQKRQKIEPQQIIAMLAWQVHILAMIKASDSLSSSEIARETKVSPYVISKSMNIARNMSKAQVRDLNSSLLILDVKLKNQSVDSDEALLQLLLEIGS